MIRLLSLSLLLLAACGLAEDERDEENKYIRLTFHDQAFETYCLEKFDSNNDGHISRYEAQRVLDLDCSNRGIASLDDLREFTRLRSLNCSANRLATLDLRYSPELERIDCSGNGLVGLRVDELRSLTTLECHNNALAVLDLASCVSLRTIDCRANQLTSLDVTTCSRTMQRLDARSCSRLTTIYCLSTQQPALIYDGQTAVVVRDN